MVRPDELRFIQFSRHLSSIDNILYTFAIKRNLELVKNAKRQPGRELHKHGNPRLMFAIHLDGYWLHMNYEDDLPHNISVSAIYTTNDGARFVKKIAIVEHLKYSAVEKDVALFLDQAWRLLNSWQQSVTKQDKKGLLIDGWKQVYPRER